MPWSLLAERLKNLPLLLAGPILRDTRPDSVTVWVALKESATVRLEVYKEDLSTRPQVVCSGTRETYPLGPNLHVVAVTTAPPMTPLQPGVVYYYDLFFGNRATALRDAANTPSGERSPFTFGDAKLPSFVLPAARLDQLRIFHGSCRKPHGEGFDALAAMAEILEDTHTSPGQRPQQLFLTGDQIYADDVADALLAMLIDAGLTLLGWDEVLPKLTEPCSKFPSGPRRKEVATKIARFTSDKGREALNELVGSTTKSHLLAFGEFSAMYLFVWSEVLWPPELPDFTDIYQADALERAGVEVKAFQKQYKTEVLCLKAFRLSLASVRRALANIPTYMIFDDHEVTDDWYMTREFCRDVLGDAVGRQVIQNGLAAYTLFQGWGNMPAHFREPDPGSDRPRPAGARFLQTLCEWTDANYKGRSADAQSAQEQLAKLLNVRPWDSSRNELPHEPEPQPGMDKDGNPIPTNALYHHYVVTGPVHQVIVTDTRTWRSFPGKGDTDPPLLLTEEALGRQIVNAKPETARRLLLVVVTTNVMTIPVIRLLDQFVPDLGAKMYKWDERDAWEFGGHGCELLFSRLCSRLSGDAVRSGAIVILSGDVHYGHVSRLQYWVAEPYEPRGKRARVTFAQLVSSAFKNEEFKTRLLHGHGYRIGSSLPAVLEYAGYNTPPSERVIGYGPPVGGVPVPWKIWRASFIDTRDVTITVPPERWYRVSFVATDDVGVEYGEGSRPEDLNLDDTDPNRRKKLEAYGKETKAYKEYAAKWRLGREVVGVNNIGELTFSGEGQSLTVTQTLWWRIVTDKDTGVPFPGSAPTRAAALSRYTVSLAVDQPPQPKPAKGP